MTEYELFKALRPLYPPLEYALLPQTANGTGFAANRHCDALALSLWPSRGLHVSGFEIKSHRGDWIREKANPAKAESIASYTNFWWIVTAHPHICPLDELPEGWGLMVWDDATGALKVAKKAPFREAKQLDLAMVAAILRKAQEVCTPAAALTEARQEGYERGKKDGESRSEIDKQDLQTLKARCRTIEKISGIRIDSWEPAENIGEAIDQVLHGTSQRQVEALRRAARQITAEFGLTEPTEADIEASRRHSLEIIKQKAKRRRA